METNVGGDELALILMVVMSIFHLVGQVYAFKILIDKRIIRIND